MTQLYLQDLAIDLDQLTELENDSIFSTETLPSEIVGIGSDFLATVRFQRNLDRLVIARSSYGILDVLSDAGGMQSILLTTFNIALSVLNFAQLDTHLASKLY